MFYGASSFDQDIGSWNVEALTNASGMFRGVTLSASNYDSLLIGWDAQNLQSGVTYDGGNSTYHAGEAARANMIASDGWTITDGGYEEAQRRLAELYAGWYTIGDKFIRAQSVGGRYFAVRLTSLFLASLISVGTGSANLYRSRNLLYTVTASDFRPFIS